MSVCPIVGFHINLRINLQSYTKNPAKTLIGIELYLEINYISISFIPRYLIFYVPLKSFLVTDLFL